MYNTGTNIYLNLQAHLRLGTTLICASALAHSEKNMQTLTVKSLKTEIHPQTKVMFWFLFASTRGAATRIRIVKLLQNHPYNANQLSTGLSMDYKAVKHHLKVLENNNLLEKFEANYGAAYYLSTLFEENQAIFDEIAARLEKSVDKRW